MNKWKAIQSTCGKTLDSSASICGPASARAPRARPGKWIAKTPSPVNSYTITTWIYNWLQTKGFGGFRSLGCGNFVTRGVPRGVFFYVFGGISQERYPNFGGGGIVWGELGVCKLPQDPCPFFLKFPYSFAKKNQEIPLTALPKIPLQLCKKKIRKFPLQLCRKFPQNSLTSHRIQTVFRMKKIPKPPCARTLKKK